MRRISECRLFRCIFQIWNSPACIIPYEAIDWLTGHQGYITVGYKNATNSSGLSQKSILVYHSPMLSKSQTSGVTTLKRRDAQQNGEVKKGFSFPYACFTSCHLDILVHRDGYKSTKLKKDRSLDMTAIFFFQNDTYFESNHAHVMSYHLVSSLKSINRSVLELGPRNGISRWRPCLFLKCHRFRMQPCPRNVLPPCQVLSRYAEA